METKYLNTVGIFECVVQEPGLDAEGKSYGWIKQAKTGTYGVHLRLTVCEGEHAGEIITHDLWLTDKSEDNTLSRLVEVFDFDGDYPRMNFAGMNCQIETESSVGNNGKTYINVKWLNPSGGKGKSKAIESEKVESLFARLGKHKALAKTVKANLAAEAKVNGGASAPRPPAPRPAASPVAGVGDDDVPF